MVIFALLLLTFVIVFGVVWVFCKSTASGDKLRNDISMNDSIENISGSIVFKVECGENSRLPVEVGGGYKDLNFRSYESGSDEWEVTLGYEGEPVPIAGSLAIEYVDGAGRYSARQIDLIRLCRYGDGDSVIDAYCRLRNARRSFLVSRIKSAVNIDTAETINDIDSWLWDVYLNSSHARCSSALEETEDGVSVLEFLARIAGKMTKPQRMLISEYVISAANPAVSLKGGDVSELSEMIRGFATDISVYRRKLLKIKGWGTEKKSNLLTFAEKLVSSRKVASPMQIGALEELKNIL